MSREAELAAAIAARFEGYYANPYLCPAGVWTYGYGFTRDLRGDRVTPDTPEIGKAEALERLRHEIAVAVADARRLTRGRLPAEATAAVADFIFNLGAGAFRASTLRQRILRGDDLAHEELQKWVYAAGRKLAGLVARRAAERQLWLSSL